MEIAKKLVCWSDLQKELFIYVASFLSIVERAKISCTAKSINYICVQATTIFHNIRNGILPIELGRPFCQFLSILRYGVFEIGLGSSISKAAKKALKHAENDTRPLHELGLMEDLITLNIDLYTYWNNDFSGEPGSGLFNYAKGIIECNPESEVVVMAEPCQHWDKHRISGTVYILKDRPDGTIIVSADMKTVYLVQGIMSSVAGLLIRNHRRLPVSGVATFLPLNEYIAFDGLLMGNPAEVNAATRKKLFKVYAAAADAGKIVSRLAVPKLTRPPFSSDGNGDDGGEEVPPVALSAVQQKSLDKLKTLTKQQSAAATWVFRRHDYTERLNPEHLVTIMSGAGSPVLMGATTRLLQPSVLELFDLLCDVVLKGRGMIPPGNCPSTVSTDELSIVKPLRALLLPVGIKVAYYPPPSQEEQLCGKAVGGCALCHIPESVLKNNGLPGLSLCAQCKSISYCSKECQKQHWKIHKAVCKKGKQ